MDYKTLRQNFVNGIHLTGNAEARCLFDMSCFPPTSIYAFWTFLYFASLQNLKSSEFEYMKPKN